MSTSNQALAPLPKPDFTAEYACLGYWVKINVYTPFQTVAINAKHHKGECLALKIFGNAVASRRLDQLQRWVKDWLQDAQFAETGNGGGDSRGDQPTDPGTIPV